MKCPNCGAALEPYDTFCSSCGKYALPLQNDAPTPPPAQQEPESTMDPKKVPQRLYPPPEDFTVSEIIEEVLEQEETSEDTSTEGKEVPQTTAPVSTPVHEHKAPKKSHKARNAAIVFALIALLAVGGFLYIFINTSTLRVQARKAQMEQQAAESHAATLETQLSQVQQELSAAKDTNVDLSAQISDLSSQINSMETSVNQSQYDKESAQRERDEAIKETDDLTASVTQLETQISDLEDEKESLEDEKENLEADLAELQDQNDQLTGELSFYDAHVVFVMTNSSDKLYHKYSCPLFDKKSFLAYNPKLAEANGYSPCPTCNG